MAGIQTLMRRVELLERKAMGGVKPGLLVFPRPNESEEDAISRTLADEGKRREEFGLMIVVQFVKSPNSLPENVIPLTRR